MLAISTQPEPQANLDREQQIKDIQADRDKHIALAEVALPCGTLALSHRAARGKLHVR